MQDLMGMAKVHIYVPSMCTVHIEFQINLRRLCICFMRIFSVHYDGCHRFYEQFKVFVSKMKVIPPYRHIYHEDYFSKIF